MKLVIGVAKVLFVGLLFLLSTTILGDRYHGSFPGAGSYPYGPGNASESVRREITSTLERFQDGYLARDPAHLEAFIADLFSNTNTAILGTMPREIYVGYDRVTELVGEDWRSWGDCRFDLGNVHVSSHGDVAWFATVGFVEFDLSSLLVLPLRLSGVLVREADTWRFQYLQFQFDLDLSFMLLLTALLGIWMVVQLICLVVIVARHLRRPQS
jgi:hypothetical protein